MAVKLKPLTEKELVGYFDVYRQAFPNWNVKHNVVLARSQGPVEQRIAFQALRAGSYRPTCSVEVLCAPPYTGILTQWLDRKHEQVFPREHSQKWAEIVKAMEEQFKPPIREPLEVATVLSLAEQHAERHKSEDIVLSDALAALNAYCGKVDRALFWCRRVEEQVAQREEPADWEKEHGSFARRLREALAVGAHASLLDEMCRAQRSAK